MRRKGDAELQVLALLLFIASMAQWAFMIGAPGQYQEAISRQADDGDALVKAGTIRAHMEEEYLPNALVDAAYQGMYTKGQDGIGPWQPGDIPDWSTAKQEFQNSINSQLSDNYVGATGSGAGCSLNGQDQISMEITGEQAGDPPVMSFDVSNDGPLHVVCEATAPATDFGAGRSAKVTELIAVPGSRDVERMRYETLHQIATEFVQYGDFRDAIKETLTQSSNYVEATGSEQYAGNCDNGGDGPADSDCDHLDSASVSFPSFSDVKSDAESAQGDMVAEELQTPLDDVADEFAASRQDDYGAIEVEAEVVDVEYDITGYHQVSDDDTEQDGFRISSCEQTCDKEKCEENTCTGCECDPTCPNVDVDCPDTVCFTSGSWETYQRGGDLWTQDPWTTSGGSDTPNDISLYNWEENHYTGPVATPSAAEPADGRKTRRISHRDRCDWHSDTCERCDSETAKNDVYQTPRRVWQIDRLSSTVTVEVSITDTEHQIPTDSGFEHPVYTVEYEQEQTWNFNGDPTIQQ